MQERENPARALFPEFRQVADLYEVETDGLSEAVLRRTREEKSWGAWSIRDQVSHVASLPYRWLLIRWGAILFGDGLPRDEALLTRFDGRMMKEAYCPQIQDLIGVMRDSFGLVWEVLGAETSESIRDGRNITERVPHGMKRPGTGEDVRRWRENVTLKAHRTGVWIDPEDTELFHFNLEYTFRHMLWEAYAHLNTIQMHKKEEGLEPLVRIPQEGYIGVLKWE